MLQELLHKEKNWKGIEFLNYNYFLTEGEKLFEKDFNSLFDLKTFINTFQTLLPNPTERELEMFRVCIREGFFLRNAVWYFYPNFTYVEFNDKLIVWPDYCL